MSNYKVYLSLISVLVILLSGCGVDTSSTGPVITNTSFPEPTKRHPSEFGLAALPEVVGRAIQITLSDTGVQEKLNTDVYGRDYIIKEVLGGSEALRDGVIDTELPSYFVSVIVIEKYRTTEQVERLYVIVDLVDNEVSSIITEN